MACSRGCCESQLEHYRSIRLSATATPSRKGPLVTKLSSDKGFEKDRPAYKRLRDQGLQPRQIDGCAEIEQRAETRVEVENMKPLTKSKIKQLEAITERSADSIRIHEPGGVMAQ
jgi:hypothetical protein